MACNRMFRVACMLWAIILWSLTIGAALVPAQNDSAWLYGIHWYADPDTDNGGSVENMTGAKGIWVLETLMTEDKNPAPWAWGLEAQFDKFKRACDRGHTLIIRIQPSWEMVVPGPGEMESFLVDVTETARRLADIAHIWQIGNEMQLEGGKYWNRTGEALTAELYVEKYKQIRNAIKSVTSSLGPQIVLLGPVAAGNTDYLGAMCDALTADDVDGFAIHAYGGSHGSLMQQIADQTTLIDHKGFAQKPIYMTEWGDRVDSALSPTSIENVANFLRHSFWELSVYNADPLNHPIVCGCWFVYQRSDQWKRWSILGLHDAGVTNDLYDAFQHAAALDLPAGNDFSAENPAGLFIGHTPAVLNAATLVGQQAPDDTLRVFRSGSGTINYTISADVDWLVITPAEGSAEEETDTIMVRYLTVHMPAGQYTGIITIDDPQAVNTPQTLSVNLAVTPDVPQAVILNPEFEDDGGAFGVASSWKSYGANKWEGIWDPQHVWTQGIADIPPHGSCGVYQTIAVNPGRQYRLSVHALSQTPEYEIAIGVDPDGSASPADATFSDATRIARWGQLTHDFVATATSATIFLDGRNTSAGWLYGKWGLFDRVAIEVLGAENLLPTARASADVNQGEAPLTVQFDGSASNDPEGDTLTYDWDFGDGTAHKTGITTSHIFDAAGLYHVTLTVRDSQGGTGSTVLTINVSSEGLPSDLLRNGDFSNGLNGWTMWIERGRMDAVINGDGQLQVQGVGHNGGLYQQFHTGGAGTEINVNGFWASDPTVANSQWAEVLIINSDRRPVDGWDNHAGQQDVVLIYKNDSWADTQGWSGEMRHTAAVNNTGAFVAADDSATIVLKSGNLPNAATGTVFDNLVASGFSGNRPPAAIAGASPQSGQSPLTVYFDGTVSSDPDGDALNFNWDFGDGAIGNGAVLIHTYAEPGTYTATLVIDDGRGGTDTDMVSIIVTQPGDHSGQSKLTIHTGFNGPLSMQFVSTAQPRLIKILDSFSAAPEIKQISPQTEIIGRIYLAEQPMDGDPIQRARQWWDRMKNIILQNPDIDYWEGYNEPIIQTAGLMGWYAQFEAERVRILAEHGRRACIANFSVGNPDLALWPSFYAAIDAAIANNGILGLHEYGTPMQQWFDFESEEGWLCGRYRKVYRQYLIPDGKLIPLAITECGVDIVPPVGWKNHFSEDEYVDQLIWYDRILQEDDYVLGATIFALEIPGWHSFDIAPISSRLADYVAP